MSRITYEDDLGVRGQMRIEKLEPGEPVTIEDGDEGLGIEPGTVGEVLAVNANAGAANVRCMLHEGLSVMEGEVWLSADKLVVHVNGDDPRLSSARPRTAALGVAQHFGDVVSAANACLAGEAFGDPQAVAGAVGRWARLAAVTEQDAARFEALQTRLAAMTPSTWREVIAEGRPGLSANDARVLRHLQSR